jgi:putative flippase GtrA
MDIDATAWLATLRRLPEKHRMLLVAVLGALIGLATYQVIYILNPFQPRAPSSWLLAFVIAVPRQYTLHRRFTFQSNVPYAPRLLRAYVLYACIATITTVLNWALVERLAVPHQVAWLACISTTGLINLFALKPLVFGSATTRDDKCFRSPAL